MSSIKRDVKKKAPLRPEDQILLEIQPTVFRYRWRRLGSCPSHKVSPLLVARFDVQDAASRTMLTMVLSEARGLSLFLVIRGGIACNG